MRLFLSSARLEVLPAPLGQWAADARVGVIMNALDGDADRRALRLSQQHALFDGVARSVTELDLRAFFDAPARLYDRLQEVDLLCVNGGDTFVLRQAMARSGFDHSVKAQLASDQIAYAGFSAGVLVLGQSLRSLEFYDGPEVTPHGYAPSKIWDGLNILPQGVIVHCSADDRESGRQVAHFQRTDAPYVTLKNGEALLIEGDASAPRKLALG